MNTYPSLTLPSASLGSSSSTSNSTTSFIAPQSSPTSSTPTSQFIPQFNTSGQPISGGKVLPTTGASHVGTTDFTTQPVQNNTYSSNYLAQNDLSSLQTLLKEKQSQLLALQGNPNGGQSGQGNMATYNGTTYDLNNPASKQAYNLATNANGDNTQAMASQGGQSGNGQLFPSTSLQGQLANQIYQKSLYTPAQQALIQQQQDTATNIRNRQLDEVNQIKSLQENGAITQDQASSQISEAQRKANNDLATLNYNQSSNTAQLQALGLIQQNQVGALTSVAGLAQGQQVSPGSTLYNPITGVQYQGTGAAPAQIISTAQQLEQTAQQQGTLQYNTDGSVNHQIYLQQAQQYYNSGSLGGNNFQQGNVNTSQQNPSFEQATPGYNYAISQGLPQNIAGATTQSPVTGDYYISGAKINPNLENQAITQGAKTGISYIPKENVGNIQQLDIAIGQMQNLNQLAPQFLSSGLLGRVKGLTTNQLNTYLQLDPGWAKFNSIRLQAIDYLKGLAQGGGFRTTEAEINTAANSLLDISDNLESAQAKMETAMKNINLAYREYLPTHKDTSVYGSQNSVVGGMVTSNGNPQANLYNW